MGELGVMKNRYQFNFLVLVLLGFLSCAPLCRAQSQASNDSDDGSTEGLSLDCKREDQSCFKHVTADRLTLSPRTTNCRTINRLTQTNASCGDSTAEPATSAPAHPTKGSQ